MGLLLSFLSLRQSSYCQNSTCVSPNEDGWLSVGWILRDAEEESGGGEGKTEGECKKKERQRPSRGGGGGEPAEERIQTERGRESKERLMGEGRREWENKVGRWRRLEHILRSFLCRLSLQYGVFPVWARWPWTKTKEREFPYRWAPKHIICQQVFKFKDNIANSFSFILFTCLQR